MANQRSSPEPRRAAPWRTVLAAGAGLAALAGVWLFVPEHLPEALSAPAPLLPGLPAAAGWCLAALAVVSYIAILVLATRPDRATRAGESAADRRMRRIVAGTAGVVAAAILGNLAYTLKTDRDDLVGNAEKTTRNLAQVIDEQAAGLFNSIDLTLVSTARALVDLPPGAPGRDARIHAALRDNLKRLPFVSALFVTDERGRMIHDTDGFPPRSFDFSDREYFRVHRDDADSGIYIGPPLVSRTGGVLFFAVSRRVENAAGGFAGVVVAAIEPDYLRRFFSSIEVGRSGSVSLFLRDGTLLARAPHAEGMLGKTFGTIPLIRSELPRAEIGTYRTSSPVDGVQRIFSYRAVPGRPLVVLVGLSQDEILGSWTTKAAAYVAVSLAFLLAVTGLGGAMARELRRRTALNASLADSEARFSRAFHASPAAQSINDIESGRFIDVNERCAHLFGYAREEIRGRESRELGLWVDPGQRDLIVERVMREGIVRDHQVRLVRKDGETRDISLSLVAAEPGSGGHPVLLALYSDMTEILRAQAEIAETGRRYRMMFDANPHPMWVYDYESMRILAVNEAAVTTYGYSREEFLAMTIRELRPAEDVQGLVDRNRRLDPGGRRESAGRHRRKDGSLIDVEALSYGLEVAGRPARLVLSDDVTAKLAAERARAEGEDLIRTVLDALDDGVLLRDRDGVVLLANPSAARMYALTPEAMTGPAGKIGTARFFWEDGRPQPREESAWFNALRDGRPRHGLVLRLVRIDDTEVLIETTALPLFRAGEPLPYAVVSKLTDISERRRAEREILRLNTELEARVAARTEELEAFSYSVSHDLRAPLRHIEGFTTLAMEGVADPGVRGHLGAVRKATTRMGQLIDDLLSLARTGRAEILRRRVDLGALVAEVRDECMRETPGRHVEWTLGTLPAVQADASLLRQVLINLLGNALKYTRQRDIARIAVAAEVSGDAMVTIRVEDNGAGFDMRYADQLFGVFRRLHSAAEFEGTGIGLATVRRIVERHGGRVWAEGEPEGGARFFFTLPAALA